MSTSEDTRPFEVSLHNTFDAVDAEDAVRQMVEWLQDTNPAETSFRVAPEGFDQPEFIDANDLL